MGGRRAGSGENDRDEVYRRDLLKAESGVLRTRPLCAYPKIARYKGTGSTDEAGSFECVLP